MIDITAHINRLKSASIDDDGEIAIIAMGMSYPHFEHETVRIVLNNPRTMRRIADELHKQADRLDHVRSSRKASA